MVLDINTEEKKNILYLATMETEGDTSVVVAVVVQVASTDKISSSAHQRGDSLGTDWSGDKPITSLSFGVMSFIVGLILGSDLIQSWITSQITSSSLFLNDFRL